MRPVNRSERLRNLGLVPTIQRVSILEYLESTDSHPTADQVYNEVSHRFPSISRATVYNTLEALTKAGAILKLSVDRSAARYDADTGPHAHFHCRRCGRVLDIPVDEENWLEDRLTDHRVESVRTYAFGVCRDCLSRKEESDA